MAKVVEVEAVRRQLLAAKTVLEARRALAALQALIASPAWHKVPRAERAALLMEAESAWRVLQLSERGSNQGVPS